MSVVLNTSVPSSALKKRHNAISYHRVREARAAKVMSFAYIRSEENFSDVLKKPLSDEKFHHLMKKWFFRVPEVSRYQEFELRRFEIQELKRIQEKNLKRIKHYFLYIYLCL